jgi:hypothetical protein
MRLRCKILAWALGNEPTWRSTGFGTHPALCLCGCLELGNCQSLAVLAMTVSGRRSSTRPSCCVECTCTAGQQPGWLAGVLSTRQNTVNPLTHRPLSGQARPGLWSLVRSLYTLVGYSCSAWPDVVMYTCIQPARQPARSRPLPVSGAGHAAVYSFTDAAGHIAPAG